MGISCLHLGQILLYENCKSNSQPMLIARCSYLVKTQLILVSYYANRKIHMLYYASQREILCISSIFISIHCKQSDIFDNAQKP